MNNTPTSYQCSSPDPHQRVLPRLAMSPCKEFGLERKSQSILAIVIDHTKHTGMNFAVKALPLSGELDLRWDVFEGDREVNEEEIEVVKTPQFEL